MMKQPMATILALFILSTTACSKRAANESAEVEPVETKAAIADAAAEPIEGDAASAWIEMTGRWAPAGACGDLTKEWLIEPDAFQLQEMSCKIKRLQLLRNGVRTAGYCMVEGYDDRVEDAFKFVRRDDATLSIINEANGAATDGLVACDEDMVP